MKNIDNAATNKISPFKKLTTEQEQLVNDIISFTKHHLTQNHPAIYTVYGDAGTGKSVILSQLFVRIQKKARTQQNSVLYHTNNYFLVNHPEILKVYKEIAGPIKELYKKDFARPTSLINQLDKQNQTIDVAVIDEAHLLLSKPDHYNNFYHDNQLIEIIKRAKVVIIVFDQYQVLRMKSLWTPERLQAITNQYPHKDYHLTHMFRMNASDELVKWFNEFTNYKLTPLPASARDHYDFRIYSDAEEMRKAIVQRNKEVGLSRILSTSGYPSTLDGGKHYIEEGRFKMPWDQYNYTVTPWAELPQTTQLQVNLDRYTDVEAFKKRADLTDPAEIKSLEKRMIMNSLNVLFKRGVYGTYLYAHDPLLRHSLTSLFEKAGFTLPKEEK